MIGLGLATNRNREHRGSARSHGSSCRQRRGVVLVAFMLVVSLTMGLAFAMLRTQGTSVVISSNQLRHARARLAAETGLDMGLQQIHDSANWVGAGNSFSVTLNSTDSVTVTYLVGDPRLTETDPDWPRYAYRVTIQAVGTSADVLNPSVVSTQTLQAVVELVPEKLTDEPSDWVNFTPYTLYQGNNKPIEIELPTRIEGPVRLQGSLDIADGAPSTNSSRDQYLSDLELMRQDGLGDHRPFEGPVYLDISAAGGGDAQLAQMNVTMIDIPKSGFSADWTKPTGITTFQLYDGGPTYVVPTVSGTVSNVSFAPDPQTNPLGLVYCASTLTLGDNVQFEGTLICKDHLIIDGVNVSLKATDLMPLVGTSQPIQLPVVTCQNLEVEVNASATITGFVAAFGRVDIMEASDDLPLVMTGKVVVKNDFLIAPRTEWDGFNWSLWYWLFSMSSGTGPLQYFPYYITSVTPAGLPYTAVIYLVPPTTPVTYHWGTSASGPVYEPTSGAPGLRWDLVWRD